MINFFLGKTERHGDFAIVYAQSTGDVLYGSITTSGTDANAIREWVSIEDISLLNLLLAKETIVADTINSSAMEQVHLIMGALSEEIANRGKEITKKRLLIRG